MSINFKLIDSVAFRLLEGIKQRRRVTTPRTGPERDPFIIIKSSRKIPYLGKPPIGLMLKVVKSRSDKAAEFFEQLPIL